MAAANPSLRALALISGAQGVSLVAYAGYVAVEGVRIGVTGPAPVSTVPGLLLEILIFSVFGVALVLVARGFLRARRWSRSPFVLAQLLGLVVAVPLAQGFDLGPRLVGLAWAASAIAGVVLAVLPGTTQSLAGEEP